MSSPAETKPPVAAHALRRGGGPRRGPARAWLWLALAPLLTVIAVLELYPAGMGVFYSFWDWRPGFQSEFTGWDNYARMLTDEVFWTSFRNLGIIFAFSVVIGWAMPLLAAELLLSVRSARAQHVYRTLLIVPMAFPGVVTVLIWGQMYEPNTGLINTLLGSIGLERLQHNWVGDPATALLALLLVGFPFVAGLPFLIFTAALANIPVEVLEAAELDGASRLRRFYTIDLPLIAFQVRLLLFLTTVNVLQYGFAAYLITAGGPNNATQVPVIRMISVAFQGNDWGYAAALSTVLFVIALALSAAIVVQRKERRG